MRVRKGLWKWIAVSVVAAIAALAALGAWAVSSAGPIAREKIVQAIEERFQSDVELKDLRFSVFPWPGATGEGLVLRHRKRTDVAPLISIRKFTVDVGWLGLLKRPTRIRRVTLEGMEINVPPRRQPPQEKKPGEKKEIPTVFEITEIVADGTKLTILPKAEGKLPLEFELSKLTLDTVRMDQAMTFRTSMTNAKPPGDIESTGKFGPWDAEEPGDSPVSGTYTFQKANLGVFKGISGTLSSTGEYQGKLNHINVKGTTDTPDFAVGIGGHKVDLKTQFEAIVDGTNGDTLLQPVIAEWNRTRIVARGGVEGKKGEKGKTITLDVVLIKGRVEDVILLAVKGKPPLTGVVSFRTKFVIPRGDEDIMDKLALDGKFGITEAEFTDFKVQDKVDALSRSAQGEPKAEDIENVVSNLKGNFRLNEGVMTFAGLTFSVPGAIVNLDGTYGLRSEELDFRGTLRMEAKLSEATTGVKSFFLKVVDPFFKKDGAGAVVPIKVTGKRESPSFGLAIGGGENKGKKQEK